MALHPKLSRKRRHHKSSAGTAPTSSSEEDEDDFSMASTSEHTPLRITSLASGTVDSYETDQDTRNLGSMFCVACLSVEALSLLANGPSLAMLCVGCSLALFSFCRSNHVVTHVSIQSSSHLYKDSPIPVSPNGTNRDGHQSCLNESSRSQYPWLKRSDLTHDDPSYYLQSWLAERPVFCRPESCRAEPLFKLRGIDVLHTDSTPHTRLADHPSLIAQALRDVPTFILNSSAAWGSLVIYFEMPSWFRSLQDLEITEQDTREVIKLKRFLGGSDTYKNEVFHVVSSLVEGPLGVRLLAPCNKASIVAASQMPISWQVDDAELDASGRQLYPCITCVQDCVGNVATRAAAAIVKRNLSSVMIDAAITIGSPDSNHDSNALLGMWRFDHVNASACPMLPKSK